MSYSLDNGCRYRKQLVYSDKELERLNWPGKRDAFECIGANSQMNHCVLAALRLRYLILLGQLFEQEEF